MIIASRGTQYTATAEIGISGLVGTISMQLVDTSGNVVTFGSTANIIELTDLGGNPTGVYVATRTAPMTVGSYVVEFSNDGSFDAETVSAENMEVVTGSVTPVLPPIPVDPSVGPYDGPCLAWTDGDRVAACCSAVIGTDTSVYDDAIAVASEVLFQLSGRKYPGQCERTVRPCVDTACGFQTLSRGFVVWPAWWWYGVNGGWWGWTGQQWRMPNFTGCGCQPLSRVLLAGYPVVEVTQVVIDGEVLPQTVDGEMQWRLDDYRFLTRMGYTDGVAHQWPSCQALDKPVTEVGTWEVTYTFGESPPNAGQMAATQLACEIYKSCEVDAECSLPFGVTRIVRQGLTVEKIPTLTWAFQKQRAGASGEWRTGLPLVDAFLNSVNPAGLKRRPTVWSPSFAYARKYGQ